MLEFHRSSEQPEHANERDPFPPAEFPSTTKWDDITLPPRELSPAPRELSPEHNGFRGESSRISWQIATPERVVFRPDLHERFSKPIVFRGRQDVTGFLYFGGLTATGYPWLDLAVKLFEHSGFHSEVCSLAGHDGHWKSFRDTGEREWIEDIHAKALAFERPPVGFFYSTSALAALEIERRHPGTFRAIVAVGAPLFLKNDRLERYLDCGLAADRFFRIATLGSFSPLSLGSVPMKFDDESDGIKLLRRNPGYRRLPLTTALALRRLQLAAREAIREVRLPFFYAQGGKDGVVSPEVPRYLEEHLESPVRSFHIYENSGHGPQLGLERYRLLHDISGFLRSLLDEERAEPGDVPDFMTRRAYLLYLPGSTKSSSPPRPAPKK